MTNPCERVDPPRVAKREMTFLDWDQAIRLAEAHSERYRALIYVAVDTGTRWSELVGLRRGKVDLKSRKIRVTEQMVQLRTGLVLVLNAWHGTTSSVSLRTWRRQRRDFIDAAPDGSGVRDADAGRAVHGCGGGDFDRR
ncbi:MAG: tyrosine-type recombinase/integrase [Ilumatobacteraceae bacterium]|nr:tyrosine-type recombinase/integrase [Ilumatobacteraceae bacterium]